MVIPLQVWVSIFSMWIDFTDKRHRESWQNIINKALESPSCSDTFLCAIVQVPCCPQPIKLAIFKTLCSRASLSQLQSFCRRGLLDSLAPMNYTLRAVTSHIPVQMKQFVTWFRQVAKEPDLQLSPSEFLEIWKLCHWGFLPYLMALAEMYQYQKEYQSYRQEATLDFKEVKEVKALLLLPILAWLHDHPLVKQSKRALQAEYALSIAAECGRRDAIQWFLQEAAIIRPISSNYNRAFYLACEHGHLSIAKWLARHYQITPQDVRKFDNYILRFSSRNGHFRVVKWVINKFDLTLDDLSSLRHFTLLSTAENGHFLLMQWLLVKFRYNTYIYGTDLLEQACHHNDLAMARWIEQYFSLKQKVFPFRMVKPSFLAVAAHGNIELFKWLLQTFPVSRDTILWETEVLARACKKNRVSFVKWMIDYFKLSPDECYQCGYDSIFHVVATGHEEMIDFMMQFPKRMFFSPQVLEQACASGRIRIAQKVWLGRTCVLTRKAKKDCGLAALTEALNHGHVEIAKWVQEEFHLLKRVKHSPATRETPHCWIGENQNYYECLCLGKGAFINGKKEASQWLIDTIEFDTVDVYCVKHSVYAACRNGQVAIAQMIADKFMGKQSLYYPGYLRELETTCLAGHLEACQWLYKYVGKGKISHKYAARSSLFSLACRHGHFALAQWLDQEFLACQQVADNRLLLTTSNLQAMFNAGHFEMLRWIVERFPALLPKVLTVYHTTDLEDTSVMDWLSQYYCGD